MELKLAEESHIKGLLNLIDTEGKMINGLINKIKNS